MSKLSSLIVLINSLSKSERKKVSTTFNVNENNADYIHLYTIISKSQDSTPEKIKELFLKTHQETTFNTSINHLFENILFALTQLRTNQDSYYSLFTILMHARVLHEKAIYHECFQLLSKVQSEAIRLENFSILLIAQKMELDYLLSLDFPDITEQELLSKQYRTNDTLKKIREINQHAFLYELLKYRILYRGTARSDKQKQEFNDLVISEMSIESNSGYNNFEITKNHLLFQSNYLMNMGDYKSAINSFYELNNAFEHNKHLLNNPPIFYLMTIEGILEGLRSIKDYKEMNYFISQLENIETSSNHFKLQIECVIFLYTLFPLLDTGKFEEAKTLIEYDKHNIYGKSNLLIIYRKAQLFLYTALTYLGTKEYSKARKSLNQILIAERSLLSLPQCRTIRLANLMVLYELKEFDYITFEGRSVRREIQNKEKTYQTELLMLKLFDKPLDVLSNKERDVLWKKIEPELKKIRKNKFELQLLRIFDFTAWIESKIRNIPLEQILRDKISNPK